MTQTTKLKLVLATSLLLAFMTLCFASATITEDLLSDEATQIEIKITQNETLIEFYLNTEGFEWDSQDIEYEDLLIENIPISTILSEINFRAEYNDGEQHPELTYFHIEEASLASFLIDNILTYLDYDLDCSELNENLELAQEILQPYLEGLEMQGNSYLEKDGNDYTLWADYGYEDTTDFEQEIAQVIETAFYSIHPAQAIPFDFPYFDLDFEVSADLSDIEYENGEYEIIVSVDGIEKVITLTLEDIEFEKIIYIPEDPEVLKIIESINGLAPGTIVSIELLDEVSYNIPSALKSHQILNITTSQETEGWIKFKVLKSEVTNKDNVALYIWEDAWNELLTSVTNETGDYYTFISPVPHFSIFMIGEIIEPEEEEDDDNGGGSSDDDDDDDDDEIIDTPIVDIPKELEPEEIISIDNDVPEETEESKKTLLVFLAIGIFLLGIVIIIIVYKRRDRREGQDLKWNQSPHYAEV